MSRKNRKYGTQWIEQTCSGYSVYGLTHQGCGPWWAPFSHLKVKPYIVEKFKTLPEYKKWRREKMKNYWNTRRIMRKHGIDV